MCLAAQGSGAEGEALSFTGYTEPDILSISVRGLADDAPAATRALVKALLDPHFDTETIRVQQRLMIRQYQAEQEVPVSAARKAGLAALYPASAAALIPECANLVISPTTLQAWLKGHVFPNRVTLAVSGRVGPAEIRRIVEEATATWLPGPEVPVAGPGPASATGMVRSEMSSDESVVFLGARAPKRTDEDYATSLVAMIGLAHGMGSRLFKRLRDDLGLAYTVDGQVVNGSLWPYMFVLVTCTTPNVDRVNSEVAEELGRLSTGPMEPAEIDRARRFADMELLRIRMSDAGTADFLSASVALLPSMPPSGDLWSLADRVQAVGPDRLQAFFARWWHAPSVVQVLGR